MLPILFYHITRGKSPSRSLANQSWESIFPAFRHSSPVYSLGPHRSSQPGTAGEQNRIPDGFLKVSFTDLILNYSTDCQCFAAHCSSSFALMCQGSHWCFTGGTGGDHLHEVTRAILEGTTTAKGQALPTGEGRQSQLADFRAAADSRYDLCSYNNISEAISW